MSRILICDRCKTQVDGEFLTIKGEDICLFCVEELLELEGKMTERTKKYLKNSKNHLFAILEDIFDDFVDKEIKDAELGIYRQIDGGLSLIVKKDGEVVKKFGVVKNVYKVKR